MNNVGSLQEELIQWKKSFSQYEEPDKLRKNLSSVMGDPLPENIDGLFKAYQDTYGKLANTYQEIENVVEKAIATHQEEVDFTISPDIHLLKSNLEKFYVAVQLELSRAHRAKANGQIVLETPEEEERILLNTNDFSEGFINYLEEEVQGVLDVTRNTSDLEEMNVNLTNQAYYPLDSTFINKGFYKDYGRGLCVLEGQPPSSFLDHETTTKALENFISPYLLHLKEKYQLSDTQLANTQKNLKVTLSTLAFQGGLLNLGESSLISTFSFNYHGANEGLITDNPLINSSILSLHKSIDEITGESTVKIRIETLLQRNGFKMWNGLQFSGTTTERIILDIDTKINDKGEVIFEIAKPDITLAITLPKETSESFQLAIKSDALKTPNEIKNPQQVDTLRSNLENIAKFSGYDSLGDFIRTRIYFEANDTEEKKQKKIERYAQVQRFDSYFIKDLGIKNPAEKTFLMQLNEDFYKNHLPKNELAKNILDFFENQLPQLSPLDKLRYFHLLPLAKAFGATPEEIKKVINNSLAESFDHQKELTEGERIGIRKLYESFYNEEITKENLNNRMFDFLQYQLNKEPNKSGRNINTSRYAFLINMAVDYSAHSLLKLFSAQKTVEILSRRKDSQEVLFEAAKANPDIYREIVKPARTPAYFFKRFRELLPNWLGGIQPKPQFSPKEHLDIITQHPDLLNDLGSRNPYRELLNKKQPQDKLDFLIHYTRDINLINPQQGWKKMERLGTGFFDKNFKDYLSKNNFQNLETLIKTGNPHFLHMIKIGDNPLKSMFAQYAKSRSLEDKLNTIIEVHTLGKTHIKERFGGSFIGQLKQQLNEVIKKETDAPSKECESLCQIFKENPWLYEEVGLSSTVKAFISERSQIIENRKSVFNEIKARGEDQVSEKSLKESLINTEFKPLFHPAVTAPVQQPKPVKEDKPEPPKKDDTPSLPQ